MIINDKICNESWTAMKKNLFKNFELLFYFILTFALMIGGSVASFLLKISIFSPKNLSFFAFLLWFLMVFSPSISAAVITGINYGKQGLKELFSGFIRVKVSWIWYLAATILLFGPFIVIVLINYFSGASIFGSSLPASTFFVFFIYNLFSGPASEELGWRGFALPRMLKKFTAITATLLQGAIWVVWHLPLVLVPDSSQATAFWPVYITLILVVNIILNWLWVNTKGSLFITVLAHYSFNFGSVLVLVLLNMAQPMTYNIVGGVLGALYLALIFILFKSKNFLPRWEKSLIK